MKDMKDKIKKQLSDLTFLIDKTGNECHLKVLYANQPPFESMGVYDTGLVLDKKVYGNRYNINLLDLDNTIDVCNKLGISSEEMSNISEYMFDYYLSYFNKCGFEAGYFNLVKKINSL